MNLPFPSPEFDEVVAALCHGTASEEQMRALAGRLRADPAARDAYLLRVELHARLASQPDLFAGRVASGNAVVTAPFATETTRAEVAETRSGLSLRLGPQVWAWAAVLAVLLGAAAWYLTARGDRDRGDTSRAVAMLNRVVNARWGGSEPGPRLGAPLEPGAIKLESGLAQIVFFNGARVVIQGPAELRLVSPSEAVCLRGTLTAEVPPQASGFRVVSPQLEVTDLGTAFGLKVDGQRAELHVFEGRVEFRSGDGVPTQGLGQGRGAVVDLGAAGPRLVPANTALFADLFNLQARSVAAEARRYDAWRESVRRLRNDPSLWVHFDFEHHGASDWRLPNWGSRGSDGPDATIVGGEWREGRWATKPALEFRGLGDRVRFHVTGSLESATLAAWIRVQGLDRRINALFMSEGFAPGTLHWVIRNDGVLGLTAFGGRGGYQILASPPVMTIDQFGVWTHVAVVLDGPGREVVHYVNGRAVSRHVLRIAPPFRIGAAELGNWNAHGGAAEDPFLIRNFSGAMDEFCLFNRALSSDELRALYEDGRPQPEAVASLSDEARPQ